MKLSKPAQKMINLVLMISAAIVAGGVVFCIASSKTASDAIFPVTSGILVSAVICLIKVLMLEYQVKRLSEMDDPKKARFFSMGQGLARFVLTGAGLVAAHYLDVNNHYALYGAIVGAFAYNIAAYMLRFSDLDEDDKKPDSSTIKEDKDKSSE